MDETMQAMVRHGAAYVRGGAPDAGLDVRVVEYGDDDHIWFDRDGEPVAWWSREDPQPVQPEPAPPGDALW